MEFSFVKGVFLRYLLMPLIMVIMVFVLGLIRKGRPAIKIKHIIIYLLLVALSIAIPGFLGFSGNLFSPYWYLISMVIYLVLGTFHVNLLHKYFRKHFQSLWKAILFESILSLTCIAAGGYLFSFIFEWMSKGLGNPFLAVTSGIIFIVPLLFYYCYIQFVSIPFDIYKTWQYDPNQKAHDFRGVDFNKLIVLNVELSKKAEEDQRFNIKAKTLATGITFGDWFFRVVDDYNFKNPQSTISLIDEKGGSYFWIFYVKRSFFSMRKYIDFEQDITDNKLTEHETIICKRVINHQEEGGKNK
ncbi:MAG: TssN family type VI secretion system protein [Flavobacteriales bacterium]